MHRRRLFLVCTIAVGATVAFASYRALRGTGMETAAEMQQALSTEIPAGTPVKDAEARLRRRGFRVSPMTDASFVGQGRLREHVDYLYGDMSEGIGLVSRRWQVAVVHQQGAVTEVAVSTGLVGP
jgi:hypothetical protein